MLVGCSIWQRVYAWIDDRGKPEGNALIALLLKLFGYTPKNTGWGNTIFTKGGVSDISDIYDRGYGTTFYTILSIGLLPNILVMAYTIYPVTIALALAVASAFLARLVFRLRKKLNGHVTDKNIHGR
jgi:hypothetical protein